MHPSRTDSGGFAIARRMVERASKAAPGAQASAVQAACEQTYRIVARSVGAGGAHALLARALGKATVAHPALKKVRIEGMSELGIRGVREMAQAQGEEAAAAALRAVLESFLGLLSHLIGDDLVAKLLDQPAADSLPVKEDAS